MRGVRKHVAEIIEACEQLLNAYGGQPEYWATEVRDWIERLTPLLFSTAEVCTGDCPAESHEPLTPSLIQQTIMRFGTLIEWWPEIMEVVKALRTRGERIAQPVDR